MDKNLDKNLGVLCAMPLFLVRGYSNLVVAMKCRVSLFSNHFDQTTSAYR
jgi:hypothetical protein